MSIKKALWVTQGFYYQEQLSLPFDGSTALTAGSERADITQLI
jgi:hypothetical protein